MRRYLFLIYVCGLMPALATAVETKIETNLSGSMSCLRLENQTIFPQRTTLSIHDHTVDVFELEAHEKLDIFVECHGVVQPEEVPMTVHTESHEWRGPVPIARTVKRSVVLWISMQRQGRSYIEGLVRSTRPTAVVKHLTLAEAPKALAQYDQIAMVLMSGADLERLDKASFDNLQDAVSLGMPLVISAREAGAETRSRLGAMTDARFSKWSAVSNDLAAKVPSATRISSIVSGPRGDIRYRGESQVILVDSPFGFGYIRMLALPFSALTKGDVAAAVFGDPDSRLAQPMRWLETRLPKNLESFFISPLIPLSGLMLLLGVYALRRSRLLIGIWVMSWWGLMLAVPVTQDALVLDKQWGVWSANDKGQAVLSRLDVDQRVGAYQSLEWSQSSLDMKALRSGSVCLVHRGDRTQVIFPPTAERVTRLFVGRPLQSQAERQSEQPPVLLPKWPKGPHSNAQLWAVQTPAEMRECIGADCEIFELQTRPRTED